MYARLLTWQHAKNIDDGVAFLREKVMPTITGLNGFRGVSASADRAGGVLSTLSLWETEADLEASFAPLSLARGEASDIIGGELTLQTFEQLFVEVGPTPPGAGSWLQVRSLTMEPAEIDENLVDFEANVLPAITAHPGFQGLRILIDRATGTGFVGTVWSDEASMRNDSAVADARRDAASARGVNVALGEARFHRVLVGDFR